MRVRSRARDAVRREGRRADRGRQIRACRRARAGHIVAKPIAKAIKQTEGLRSRRLSSCGRHARSASSWRMKPIGRTTRISITVWSCHHELLCMVSALSQKVTVLGVQRIGRYEVLDHLASGGMGQVYLARSTGLGGFERQVVVKTLDLGSPRTTKRSSRCSSMRRGSLGAASPPVHRADLRGRVRRGRPLLPRHGLRPRRDRRDGLEARARARRAAARVRADGRVVASRPALDYAHNLCTADGRRSTSSIATSRCRT